MFESFPYTNYHNLNLDWILKRFHDYEETLQNFVSLNTIKYADPFDWDITRQYSTNTIVMDPLTGIAYISVKPVPSGAQITDTNYWTPVFDLSLLFEGIKDSIAALVEESDYATENSTAGTLVWVGNTLYRTTVDIAAGARYVSGGNVERITIEELINQLKAEQAAQAQALEDETEARIEADAAEKAAREAADADMLLRVQHMKFPHAHATEHLDIFVAASSGDDSKDGLTEGNAIRTLKHAFEIMADNAAGVYIHFIEGGDYDMGYPVISGCMLHLQGTRANGSAVSGVNVNWGWDDANWTLAFYNCYIHMDNLTLNITQSMSGDKKRCYLESGKFYAYKVKFNATSRQTFGIIGGAGQFDTCVFNVPVQASGSNVVFDGCTFNVPVTNENETVMVHAYRSSTITFINSIDHNTVITVPNATDLVSFFYGTSATVYINMNLGTKVVGNAHVFANEFAQFANCAVFGQFNNIHDLTNTGNGVKYVNTTVNGGYARDDKDAYNVMVPMSNVWNPVTNTVYSFTSAGSNGSFIILGSLVAGKSCILYRHYNMNNNVFVNMSDGSTTVPDGYTLAAEQNKTTFTITPTAQGCRQILVIGAYRNF